MPLTKEEYMDERGAKKLAGIIRKYWSDRGYDVLTTIAPVTAKMGARSVDEKVIWVVRSDMLNGMPRWRKKEMAA